MDLSTLLLLVATAGLVAGLVLARSRHRVLVLEGVGLLAAIALTLYGIAHADDPDCRECGGGFFAGLFSAVGFVLWSVGLVLGAASRALLTRFFRGRRRT